jgi:hypothetical protein
VAGAVSGFLIFLPLLIRFRRPSYVLGVFFPLVLGIPIGLGLASLWIQKLSVTTSFLFAILGGLGVETGIHLFSRYLEERRFGKSVEEALVDLFVSMGPAVLTSVSTLAVTFLLMIFGNFRGFSEFGFISGVGLYVLFLMYFSVFPAGLVLLEKLKRIRVKPVAVEHARKIRFSPGFVRVMLGICTVLTLLSIFAVPKLKFEYDTRKIRADRPESRMAKIKQDAVGFPRFSPAVVLISGEKQSEALEAAVERKKAENPRTLIDLTRSIYSLVPKDQEEKMAIIRQMIQLLSDDALNLVKGQNKEDLETFKGVLEDHSPFTLADVPPEVKKHFLGETNSESFFMIYKKPSFDLDDGRYAIRFAEELQEIKTPVGTFQATSDSIVFADVLRTLFKDSRKINPLFDLRGGIVGHGRHVFARDQVQPLQHGDDSRDHGHEHRQQHSHLSSLRGAWTGLAGAGLGEHRNFLHAGVHDQRRGIHRPGVLHPRRLAFHGNDRSPGFGDLPDHHFGLSADDPGIF